MKRYDKKLGGWDDGCGDHEPKPQHYHASELGHRAQRACKASARQAARKEIADALSTEKEID